MALRHRLITRQTAFGRRAILLAQPQNLLRSLQATFRTRLPNLTHTQ
jgi:hypothetical protein